MVNFIVVIVCIFNILLIVVFFLLLYVASLIQVMRWISLTAVLLRIRLAQLFVDVLNLTLHLLIRTLHQIHEHVEHAESIRLLL